MPFTSLISRSVLQRLNLYYSLFSLSNSSHFSMLLCFYFPFYPSPLILLQSQPFIFPFSCFIVQWIACSPFLISSGYHVCLLFTSPVSLSLSPCVSHSLWQFRGCPCGTPDRSCHQLSPRPGQPGIWDARTRHRRVKSCQYEYYSKLSLPLFILTSPAALTLFLTSGWCHDISPAHKHLCLSASNTHNFEIF